VIPEAETLFHRALDVSPEDREARLAEWCGADEELLREVRSLVDAFEAAEAAGPPERPADRWIGRELGRYRLERLLGAGGMGAVYLASRTDGAFRMNVAIKVLGSRVAPVLHERILMERQILAELEHANIARLIDGGITDDGEVYLVMEHVDGVPLDRHAADRQLSTEETLRLFVKVCDAIEYAHRKLVLHRDLKPANILVGGDGEPKLLDFGNAKLMDADVSAGGGRLTRLGFRAFTPEFASPEQVLGGPVSAACDVYSLGVILYRLVTGRPPYEFKTYSSGEFVTVLRDHEPPPPSAAKAVDGDIDAIVMKALRKLPEDRYPTVAAFSEDVRRHLDGRPVTAREPTRRYRAAKFLWRRRHAIAASAGAAMVLAGGLALTAWQARRARAEEQRANRQFRNIRELNHALLFDFYNAVQALPGSTEVQRALVTESISYMDRLRREADADREIAMDVIEGFIRLGNLQGNPYSDNLAEPAAALETLRKALDLATALERRQPGDARVRRLMALAEQGLGEVYFGSNDRKSAALHLEMAGRLMDEIVARPPLAAAALVEAAAIQGVMGDIYSGSHGGVEDAEKAMARFERAERLQLQALEREPGNERARRGVAISKMKRAGMTAETRPGDAARLVGSALEELGRLPEQARSSMPNLRLEAMLHTKLAATLPSLGLFADGIAHARDGLRIYESLAALDPENGRTKVDLANAWFYWAEALDYRAGEKGAGEKGAGGRSALRAGGCGRFAAWGRLSRGAAGVFEGARGDPGDSARGAGASALAEPGGGGWVSDRGGFAQAGRCGGGAGGVRGVARVNDSSGRSG
jgi:tetratricopeptide (TPR) repeat protein/predicted Ser/Thr protein kinase